MGEERGRPPRAGARRSPTDRAGRAAALALLAGAAALTACYGFSGGGGLPSHIRTAFVEPVRNQSTRFGISELLGQRLLEATRQRLGLRLAAEPEADAIVRATVTRYSDEPVNFEAREGVGADVFLRRVTVGARVEIYDVGEDRVLWQSSSVTGVGEYEPENQTEETALEIAIGNLVQSIVDGAQSQW